MKPVVLFMADGEKHTGFGHIMRCLYLAKRMPDCEIVFYINKESDMLLKNNDYECYLNENIIEKISIKEIKAVMKSINPDIIILSSEMIKQGTINFLKRFCKILVLIDDIRYNTGDMTINFNAFANREKYKTDNVFTGIDYAFIKPEFMNFHKKEKYIKSIAKDILITMGTSDPLNLTEKSMNALKDLDVKCKVVIGPEKSLSVVVNSDRFEIIKSTNEMEKLLYNADIAIISGGITVYEAACVGTPAIVLCQSKNQLANASSMHNKTLINMGYGSDLSIENIKKTVLSIISDRKKMLEFSRNGKELIDCNGIERVVSLIKQHMKSVPELKPVSKKDLKKIWLWRNDYETRKNSFNPKVIPFDGHQKWFSETLKNNSKAMIIAVHEKNDIGIVRIDKNTSEIHININPKFRNMGYGKKVLRISVPYAFNVLKLDGLIARIKPENKKSINVFASVGFLTMKKTNKEILMKLSLNT